MMNNFNEMELTDRGFGNLLARSLLERKSHDKIAKLAYDFSLSYQGKIDDFLEEIRKDTDHNKDYLAFFGHSVVDEYAKFFAERDDLFRLILNKISMIDLGKEYDITDNNLFNISIYLQSGLPTRKLIYPRFQIDTNRINTKGNEESMNQLEKWKSDGVIDIQMSAVALKETGKEGMPRHNKAITHIITYTENLDGQESWITQDEQDKIDKIANIVFPCGVKSDNEKNDVKIIFHAIKYHFILVTNDGNSKAQPRGILGSAAELKQEFGLEVIKDDEAVEKVKKAIQARDKRAQSYSDETGMPLPDWVGKD